MKYKVLTAEDEDDVLAAFLMATERDHYCHSINEQRYETMLPELPDGAFKDRIIQLLNETKARKTEVELILTKTHAQTEGRDIVKLGEAITRLKARKPM